MDWDKATDIILYTAIAMVGVFGILGLYQWVTRKSLKKVDRPLLALLVPLILMVATYLIFDKFLILNTRPDGSGEPSFPSTHTMVVATVFCCAMLLLPRYLRPRSYCFVLDFVLLAFIILTAVGRVLANKHWSSDVVAGLIFAAIFTAIYGFIVKNLKNRENSRKVSPGTSRKE